MEFAVGRANSILRTVCRVQHAVENTGLLGIIHNHNPPPPPQFQGHSTEEERYSTFVNLQIRGGGDGFVYL